MALIYRLFLSLLIFLMVLHLGAANDAPQKSQEAADSLADSMAAWQKDGLELLGEPGAHVKADGLRKFPIMKHTHNSTEMDGETTKEAPNGHEHTESIFCHGAGCMIGIVIVLVAVPAGILMGSLAICWWYERKRHLSGNQQERSGLITGSDSRTSSPEPAPQ